MRSILRSLAVALLVVVGAVSGAWAEDTIMLNDGNIYTGTILSETEEMIEIDTKIGSIPTKLKIDRGRILSIVRDHRQWTPGDEPGEQAAAPGNESTGVLVMEIPIVGEFGKEVLPISFGASLDYARRQKVKHIVLRVNSPGGQVWAARQILQDIEAHRGEFEFHALVESAISAAIWPTFACETIHMAPAGTLGGAVVYRAGSRGSVEVDAKMNSILASEVTSIAESLGHDGGVVRAMILMPSELYAQRDGERIVLSSSRPADRTQAVDVVDGPTTVLTLTTVDAAKYGIARPMRSASVSEVMKSVGVDEIRVVDGGGIVDRWTDQCERRRKLAKASLDKLKDYLEEYESTKDIDEAIAALQAYQREHPRFARYLNDFFECYPFDESINREEVAEESEKVREAIAELRKIKREGP